MENKIENIIPQSFTGIWIDREILFQDNLSLNEKVIISIIKSFEDNHSKCFASNKFFSELLKLSPKRTSEIINGLVAKGFITSEMIFHKNKKSIEKRILRINNDTTSPDISGYPLPKNTDTSPDISGYPLPKNTEDIINTYNKNDKKDYNINISSKFEHLDVNDDISKFTPQNVITVKKADAIARIYKAYPRKEGKTKGVDYALEYLTGRKISGLGTFKYNHEQLYCAVREYAIECEEKFTEKRYIKLFSSFMNGTVTDYIEQSVEGYEDYMQRTYGDEWRNITFKYIP